MGGVNGQREGSFSVALSWDATATGTGGLQRSVGAARLSCLARTELCDKESKFCWHTVGVFSDLLPMFLLDN